METTLKWIIGTLLLLAGAWLMGLNSAVFWRRHVQKRESSSWIPLLGGMLGAAGLLLIPFAPTQKWWWLPLVLDWGCLPGISYSILFHLVRAIRTGSR